MTLARFGGIGAKRRAFDWPTSGASRMSQLPATQRFSPAASRAPADEHRGRLERPPVPARKGVGAPNPSDARPNPVTSLVIRPPRPPSSCLSSPTTNSIACHQGGSSMKLSFRGITQADGRGRRAAWRYRRIAPARYVPARRAAVYVQFPTPRTRYGEQPGAEPDHRITLARTLAANRFASTLSRAVWRMTTRLVLCVSRFWQPKPCCGDRPMVRRLQRPDAP